MTAPAFAVDCPYPIKQSSDRHPESHRPPIAGGTLSPTPLAVITAWIAYRDDLINRRTYRVWWALAEVADRRDIAKARGVHPFHFTVEHIIKCLSTSAPVRRVDVEVGFERLAELGLAVMTRTKIVFVNDFAAIHDRVLRHEVVASIENLEVGQFLDKPMTVPRRMVAAWLQEARGSRVAMGVELGLLVRIAFMSRYPDWRGCVKGWWLEVFSGGSRSAVKRELQGLERDRKFERIETKQRVLNKCGQWWLLNPDATYGSEARAEEPTGTDLCGKVVEMGPLDSGKGNKIGPLKNHIRPSDEKENHTQVSRARTRGVTHGVFTQHPKALSVGGHQQAQETLPAQGQRRESLRGIQRWELRDPGAVNRLFEAAVEAGHVSDTLADRRLVFELACHAVRVGKFAGALFYRDLVTPAYHRFISAEDEDVAGRMLAELEAPTDEALSVATAAYVGAGDSPAVVPAANGDRAGVDGASEGLPDDVDVVRTLSLALMGQGVPLDQAFDAVMAIPEGRRRLAGWDRERWDAAYRKAVGGTVQGPADDGAVVVADNEVDELDCDAGDIGSSRVRGTLTDEDRDRGVSQDKARPWESDPVIVAHEAGVLFSLWPRDGVGDPVWHAKGLANDSDTEVSS